MRGRRLFRQLAVLGFASSVSLTLTGCGDPMLVGSRDGPEKVAASFVYWIGKNDAEDAGGLLFSTEDKPISFDSDNIDELRQRAGMNAGCVLGDSWESRVSVIDEGDHFAVTVPVKCGREDNTTTITVTKTGNEWGKHWVVVD